MNALYDRDTDARALRDKTIAVLGYGSQGRAHALNLQDSGFEVIVGLRAGSRSREQAARDGVDVREIGDAVASADVVMVLAPDEEHGALFRADIAPNLKRGVYLAFAHGFSIHFGTVVPANETGLLQPVQPIGHGPGRADQCRCQAARRNQPLVRAR